MIVLRILVATLLLACVAGPARAQEESPGTEPSIEVLEGQEQLPEPTPMPAVLATPAALTTAEIAAKVSPSVVRVVTDKGIGSAVSTSVGVLTAWHVIAGASSVELVTNADVRVPAAVARSDPTRDLALLQPATSIPSLELELAADQHQGDEVVALGYALNISGPALSLAGWCLPYVSTTAVWT